MARFCPHCGAELAEQFAFCPKCGAKQPVLKEESVPQPPVRAQQEPSAPVQSEAPVAVQSEQSAPVQQEAQKPAPRPRRSLPAKQLAIQCKDSGAAIAKAIVPEDFTCVAKIYPEDYNDFSTFRDAVLVYNNELGITIRSDSRVFWEEYTSFLTKQGAALGGLNPSNQGNYREPEDLMLAYGKPSENAVLRPYARAVLPGWFAQNGQKLLDHMIQNVKDSDQLVTNVKTDIVNTTCQPILMKFVGQDDGKDIVVLVGCEFLGFEYRNAINPLTVMGGTLGLLGGLMSMAQSNDANKRSDGPVPFGHGKDYGRQTEIIHWGYNRIYSCVTPPEHEAEATEAFLNFAASFSPDEALEQRRAQREYEISMAVIRQSNVIAAQARQNQMLAQQRAMETSRMIARNSAEMSAGIMDSWNKKMASDSRISAARSEAIRGVNTYQTTYGTPVEVSVAADHVYQNNYGDVYGVSGTAVDQDVLNQLNWTEIHQK